MANRIKKGDQVVINTGKDKGKQGEVVRVDGDRVIVSNANIIKRHTKPNPQAGVA
ncbi:KOW motif-containing protein, partial [Xanthomonas hortorum pv. pelargonii]